MGILTVCFSNILACILCWILVLGILMVPPMFFATQSTGKLEDFFRPTGPKERRHCKKRFFRQCKKSEDFVDSTTMMFQPGNSAGDLFGMVKCRGVSLNMS